MARRKAKAPEEKGILQDPYMSCVSKLILGVLERAVRDYVQYRHSEDEAQRREYALDAWDWFMEDEDKGFTSFASVCKILEADTHRMRERIATYAQKECADDGFFESSGATNKKDSEREA